MKTCCPHCQTVFRITPVQLKARAGNVRCGRCQSIFNALDHMVDVKNVSKFPPITASPLEKITGNAANDVYSGESGESGLSDLLSEEIDDEEIDDETDQEVEEEIDQSARASDSFAQQERLLELGKQSGMISARQTTEVPGYSKWTEGAWTYIDKPRMSTRMQGVYLFGMIIAVLVLSLQLVLFFRSEIVSAKPQLRPALTRFCKLFGYPLYFPRHSELISIESSSLHNDPSDPSVLILNATLRNQANFSQEFPAIEVSLTDNYETVVLRKVLLASDYLPAASIRNKPFSAHEDIPIKLWIKIKGNAPSGYRLYAFYP